MLRRAQKRISLLRERKILELRCNWSAATCYAAARNSQHRRRLLGLENDRCVHAKKTRNRKHDAWGATPESEGWCWNPCAYALPKATCLGTSLAAGPIRPLGNEGRPHTLRVSAQQLVLGGRGWHRAAGMPAQTSPLGTVSPLRTCVCSSKTASSSTTAPGMANEAGHMATPLPNLVAASLMTMFSTVCPVVSHSGPIATWSPISSKSYSTARPAR
mmetsp:Transcript_77108/g.193932  ORF Transcript_77108/g.193932 Transcript_77108/m.193932 type:complete len:216 (-) Transcript_77108:1281-1928(-)